MVRIKHRYLLVNILYPTSGASQLKVDASTVPEVVRFRQPSPSALDKHILTKLIRHGVSDLFGDYGAGKIAGSLKIMYLSTATSTAIIRVARDHYRLVWTALTFATMLPRPVQTPCVFQVLRISGTIRKSEEAAIKFAKQLVTKARRAGAGQLGEGLQALADAAAIDQMDVGGIEDQDDESDVADTE